MRAIAAVLLFTSACATTHGEGGGDHDMATMLEGALFVGGVAGASYDCASHWDDCKGELLWGSVATAAIATVIGGIVYGWVAYDHHMNAQIEVHVRATPRAGDVALAFTWPASGRDPRVGDHQFLDAVEVDPSTGAELTTERRSHVCVAYAPRLDAPIDEVHCAPARPLLLFTASR